MTDQEIKALLSIAKTNGNAEISMAGVNVQKLVQLSFRHKTIYQLQVYAQHYPGYFTPEQLIRLETRSRKIAMQSLTQLHELQKIAGVFNLQGIGTVCIKGPQLSRMIYGREALKESVDLDIMLTRSEDLVKVHALLHELGYDQSNLNDYPGKFSRKIFLIAKREVHYFNRQNRCAIDLHIRPGANTYLTENRFKGFLEDLTWYDLEGTQIPVLKDEAYLVYLCYHGSLHQFARLAWLMDIRAFLILKHKELDFEKVLSIARERKIERCVYLALKLIQDYFNEKYTDHLPHEFYRLSKLADQCKALLIRDASYGLTLRGRAAKFRFVMKLLRGMPAKADWIYGILVRQFVKLLWVW